MASNRYNGNVVPFADNATGSNRTVFGDTNLSDDINDNLNDDYKLGWEIVGINDSPTKQDFNALGFTQGKLISHLYQQGISEYNAKQEYYVNSLVMGSNGVVYQSLSGMEGSPNVGNNPVTDETNWKLQSGTGIFQIDTVDDFETVPSGIDTVIVKDLNRGGTFIYDATQSAINNGGTIFNGWVRQYDGDIQIEWFDNNIDNIELKLSNFNVNLGGKTIIATSMPHKNSFYNGIISVNNKLYTKPKISKNHLWQGLFGTTRSFAFGCKNFRIPGYDGWTIATHSATNADNFYTVKTNKGIKIFRVNGSIINDTVSLVANLPKKISKDLMGQGCFIKTKINKGSGYNGDVFLTVNASNYLEQPITNNIGTYTNGNNVIKNIELETGENITPCLLSSLYEQIAINISISFSGASSVTDYIEIEYVGLGLNNFFDILNLDKDTSKKYLAMSYSDGMQIGSANTGCISKVATTATIATDKVIHTQNIDLDWAISATCYDILGNDLEMYDVNDEVSKYAMIDNLSNKGFTIRNNQDITVGNKVLFHYVAEGVL